MLGAKSSDQFETDVFSSANMLFRLSLCLPRTSTATGEAPLTGGRVPWLGEPSARRTARRSARRWRLRINTKAFHIAETQEILSSGRDFAVSADVDDFGLRCRLIRNG